MKKSLFLIPFLICLALASLGFSQERKALSVVDIETLLKAGVSQTRVDALIEEWGVDFEVTAELREKLEQSGAGSAVMLAVDRAALRFARSKLEEQKRTLEKDRQKVEGVNKEKRGDEQKGERQLNADEMSSRAAKELLTIASLTRGLPDSNSFDEYQRRFNRGFDDVWLAVNGILKEYGETIVRADKDTGVVTTDFTRHGILGFPKFDSYYVLVEKVTESSTLVSMKLFTYWVDFNAGGVKRPENRDFVRRRAEGYFLTRLQELLSQSK